MLIIGLKYTSVSIENIIQNTKGRWTMVLNKSDGDKINKCDGNN